MEGQTLIGREAVPSGGSCLAFVVSIIMTRKTNIIILAVAIVFGTVLSANAQTKAFAKTLKLRGVTFIVKSSNKSTDNKVTITTRGLTRNATLVREVDGRITGAEVADINVDGFPELYIYATSAGSGSYGSLVAFGSNKNKSLSDIFLPEIAAGSKESIGFMGHDEFAVVEGTLVRRFPVYKPGDSNAKPTGGMRQIQYKLKAGEAGWVLYADKVVDF